MSENGKKKNIDLKILLIGDSNVGKTTLLLKYLQGEFILNLDITWKGVNLFRKSISIESPGIDPINYFINIWDIAGSEHYMDFFSLITEPMHAIIIQTNADVQSMEDSIKKWTKMVNAMVKSDFLKYLIVTKREGEVLDEEKISQLKTDYNFTNFFILDSKNTEEVNSSFEAIIKEVISQLT